MDAISFTDLQEALIWFFGPVLIQFMFVMISGGVLTAIGVIALGMTARLSR